MHLPPSTWTHVDTRVHRHTHNLEALEILLKSFRITACQQGANKVRYGFNFIKNSTAIAPPVPDQTSQLATQRFKKHAIQVWRTEHTGQEIRFGVVQLNEDTISKFTLLKSTQKSGFLYFRKIKPNQL